jgi:hypothetical protein
MANTTPAGNGGRPQRIYTAAERAVDPAGVNTLRPEGVSERAQQMRINAINRVLTPEQIIDALEAANDSYNELGFLAGIPTSPQDGFNLGSRASQFAAVYESTSRDFPANFAGSFYDQVGLPKYLFDEQIYASKWYKPRSADNSYINEQSEREIAPVGIAAPLSDIPTSSSNYVRPRTVAAGWLRDEEDQNSGTLTVVFRDGTLWNYYGVSVDDWNKFHWAYSKGALLKPANEMISFTSDGPATIDLSKPAMQMLYNAARTAQIMYRESKARGGYKTKGTGGSQGGGSARRIKTNLTKEYARVQARKSAAGGSNPSAKNGINPNQK